MSDKVHLTLDAVRALTETVLNHIGLTPPHVAAVSDTIVAGERDGCTSHGIYRLLVVAHSVRAGKVVVDAEPVVRSPAPALVQVDADGGFAQLAFQVGRPLLVEKANAGGIAALAINRCVHFAALWPEVEALAGLDRLVTLACTPSHAWVAPAGGTKPVFGTNPIAFGWPRPGPHPFVFDFATSATARGEIELHRRRGQPIPDDWGVDADGHPSIDAEAVLNGAMRAFGGHKGSALAAMVELLAGPLIGDMTSAESIAADAGAKASPLGGELIIAISPASFLGAHVTEHLARAETMFAGITDQGARLPSERRYSARARSLAEGVAIDAQLHADVVALLN